MNLRKFTLAALMSVTSVLGFSQDIVLVNPTSYVWGDVSNSLIQATVGVKNNTTSSMDVKVRRTANNNASGHSNYFCWDVCYGPSVNNSAGSVTIAPGQTSNAFYLDLLPNSTSGLTTVDITFENAANTTVYTTQSFIIDVVGVGFADALIPGKFGLSNAHPNPSNGNTKIAVSVPSFVNASQVKVFDAVGRLAKLINVESNFGEVGLDLSNLNEGVYFYSLIADGKTIATRRLVISR
jgi:hypothetical protein